MYADIPTLLLVVVVISLLLAFTVGFASRGHGTRSLRWWALVMLGHGVAYFVLALRGTFPDLITVVLGNTLLAASFALALDTVAGFQQRRYPPWLVWGPVPLTAILFHLYIDDQTQRLVFAGLIYGGQQLLTVHATLARSSQPRGRGHVLLAVSLLLTAGALLVRTLGIGSGAIEISGLLTQSPTQTITYLLAVVVPLLSTVGFVFMVMEQAKRQASIGQNLLDAIFDSIEESVAMVDRAGTILSINRVGALRLDSTPEQLLGSTIRSLMPGVAEQRLRVIERVLQNRIAEQLVDERNGIRFRLNFYPVRDNADMVVMYGTDITHAQAAEEALRRSEAHFRAFFERSMVGMATTSLDKGWIEVNDALCAMFGYPREELLNKTWAEITHPDDLAADEAEFRRVVAGVIDEYEMDKRFVRKDGVIIDAHIAARCVRRDDGGIDYFVALVDDISERKQRERELAGNLSQQRELNVRLEEAHNQLLQSEKMASIGQLAAGVAHELNNPIGFVHSNLGTLDIYLKDIFQIAETAERVARLAANPAAIAELDALLREKDFVYLKQDIFQLLGESKDGLGRVRKIVQDLKDFSRVGENHWQWADVHHGLDSTLNIVWNELKYKCTVTKHFAPDLPQIRCLPSQLNQVFMNLLVNAAQAIEPQEGHLGEIVIETRRHGTDGIQIEIRDTGKGIPDAQLKRIFEPFFTTKPVGKGTGLGLSIAWGIIGKHQGHIDVASTPGVGTRFTVSLPIKPANATDEDAP